MDPSQLPTAIVGIALGGALTYIFNFMTEARRWKREDGLRWHEEKRRAYAEALGLAISLDLSKATLSSLEESLTEARASWHERVSVVSGLLHASIGSVQLMASDRVVEAHKVLVESVVDGAPDSSERRASVKAALDSFVKACQADLGINGQPSGKLSKITHRLLARFRRQEGRP